MSLTCNQCFSSLQFETRSVHTTWWTCARRSLVRQYRLCTREELTCQTFVHSASSPRSVLVSSSRRLSQNCFPTSACQRVQSARASDVVWTSAFAFRFDTAPSVAVLPLLIWRFFLRQLPRVGPGHPPLFPLFPLSIYFVIFCLFYFSLSFIGFTYFLLLSIPSLSTRIVPHHFQAGGHRKWPNLGLVCFVCVTGYLYSLV